MLCRDGDEQRGRGADMDVLGSRVLCCLGAGAGAGAGAEVYMFTGAQIHRWRYGGAGAEAHRSRGAEMQRCRGAEVQRCRVQR
jgi:hypothetical protein